MHVKDSSKELYYNLTRKGHPQWSIPVNIDSEQISQHGAILTSEEHNIKVLCPGSSWATPHIEIPPLREHAEQKVSRGTIEKKPKFEVGDQQ